MTTDPHALGLTATNGGLRQVPVEDAVSGLLGVISGAGLGAVGRVGALVNKHDSLRSVSRWSLRRLAQQGVITAQRKLGYHLACGEADSANMTEAFQWLRQAARRGDAAAQYAVGVMYANGQGVSQCTHQASLWYRRAAEQGHPASQFNLGLLYAAGNGVPCDVAKARYWYERAAEQDYPRALFNLAVMLENGSCGVPEPERALTLYNRAAELGFSHAHLRLGQLYFEQPERVADACFWFTLATLGFAPGAERDCAGHGRDECHQAMRLAEIEAVRQRIREWRGV